MAIIVKPIEVESKMWLPGLRGGGNGEFLFNMYRVLVIKIKF